MSDDTVILTNRSAPETDEDVEQRVKRRKTRNDLEIQEGQIEKLVGDKFIDKQIKSLEAKKEKNNQEIKALEKQAEKDGDKDKEAQKNGDKDNEAEKDAEVEGEGEGGIGVEDECPSPWRSIQTSISRLRSDTTAETCCACFAWFFIGSMIYSMSPRP
eukprot:g10161.t1